MNKPETDLQRRVMEHVGGANYRPVKPRVISKQLHLADDEFDTLRIAIKKLVQQGKLRFGPKHLVLPAHPGIQDRPAPAGKLTEGVFRRNSAGFGFVRPTGTPHSAGRTADIFIPRHGTLDASSGDTVLVRMARSRSNDGRTSGEIVEVVSRDTHRFVGTYFEREGEGYVAVDGAVFAQAISVGDPGAKRVQLNDKVVVEIVRFPTPHENGEGVVVENLGARGAPGVDTLAIIREYDLPDEFPDEVLAAARAEADRWTEGVPPGRTDLTGEVVITIDPVDARDFDDAISLTRLENGHYRLGVHIADVSHFVRAGGVLDREARQRATSVYLPDRVLPMLPEVISNNLASLQPGKIRYTQTAFLEFTPDGVRVDTETHTAAIKSQRRFTYEEIDEYLADPPAWRSKLTPGVHELVGRMHELAMILRKRRLARGAIELSLPEVKVDLDADGRVSGAHVAANTVSHQMIEEFMLAANEAVAELFRDKELAFLRRIHEMPDPRKLATLTEFVRDLGIETDDLESRFEIKRVIEAVKDRPEKHAVNYAVLRSMQKAVYSPDEQGHYALASDCYCHFTSPIRRYPDLTVHRTLESLNRGKGVTGDFNELVILGQHCSEREQRAEAAERDLKKIKLLTYLSQKLGEEMNAVITGVEEFGIFAQGVELPAEGLIHTDALTDDFYYFDGGTHSLTGRRSGRRFRLGDVIRVRVQHVDLDRRELDFRLVEMAGAAKPGDAGDASSSDSGPKKWPRRAHETKSPGPPKHKSGKGGRELLRKTKKKRRK